MINKHNLAVASFTSDEDSRYALSNVLFTPSETIATNSHYLVRVSNPPSETIQTTTRPFLIPAEQLKPIKVKNGDSIELASNGTGSSWNLTTGTSTFHLEESNGAERFPNVDAIMPKDAPAVRIAFDAVYLEKLVKAFASFNKKDGVSHIEVSVWTPEKPIRISAKNEQEQTMTALLMPRRL